MPRKEDLRTVHATVTTAEANIGSAVPQNYRRYIWKVKAINAYNGENLLTLGKREDGAGATTTIDQIAFATKYETWEDPDSEITEESIPLYIIEGKGETGDSYLRAVTDNGNAYLTIWYTDEE